MWTVQVTSLCSLTVQRNSMTHVFTALTQDILRVRTAGTVSLHLRPLSHATSSSDVVVIDAFIREYGFNPLNDAWLAISREQAEMLVLYIIACDLSYRSELTDLDTASRLAERFMACFTDDVRCYTNGTWYEADTALNATVTRGAAWTPITSATFDTGVVCLDNLNIGMLWVEDED
jgi:hypothetical protein